jgi:hypothetical protein
MRYDVIEYINNNQSRLLLQAVIHSPLLFAVEIANCFDISRSKMYPLFFSCLNYQRILRSSGLVSGCTVIGTRMTVALGGGIVGHGYPDKVVEDPHTQLLSTQRIAIAGVWDENQLSTFLHQLACRFREFAVSADKGANSNGVIADVEGRDQ